MPFKRDTLSSILNRTYANYASLFNPLDKTPRHNLLKVLSAVDAGIYHQLQGDLDFLALQLFPDTATGDSLREHWSMRVPPLYATAAFGKVMITGLPNRPVSVGLVFASVATSERYYTEKQYRLDSNGFVIVDVRSENFGANTNLQEGDKLKIVSAVPAGIDSEAEVAEGGIAGGVDGETNEEYLIRVITCLRNTSCYGKPGDFAKWAGDSSAEVSAAWEFPNFGIFGALLIQVINGNQLDGVNQVSNLNDVTNYINARAPFVTFTVRTPQIITFNPAISLLPNEDSLSNRALAINRIQTFLQLTAKPGYCITSAALRDSIVDGITISHAVVKLAGNPVGTIQTTILQYPVIGEVLWE
jgi:uncharacterized phage protein gp47/JayE